MADRIVLAAPFHESARLGLLSASARCAAARSPAT